MVACETSWARPIAMPFETPIPWRTKLIDTNSPLLVKLVADELHQGGHRLGLVRAMSLQPDRRADAGGEQHHSDHAARARPLAIPYQGHVAAKLRGDPDDLGARSRMQA